jgi:hypothetical protein
MTKWTTYLAAVLVALAFALPAGAQGNGQYAQVLGERAQAGARAYDQIERARSGMEPARAYDQIESARARSGMESALNKPAQVDVRAYDQIESARALKNVMAVDQPTTTTEGDGFAWAAAGSGAGAMFALVLVGFGVAILVRRSRHQVGEAI